MSDTAAKIDDAPRRARAVRGALAFAVVGAVAIAAAARLDPVRRATRDDVYTIPPGTAERVARGESVADVLPQRVGTTVGNRLIVVNHDVQDHAFGPFVLAPGQRWARQFAVVGDYAMDCTIYPDAGFNVHVEPGPTPAGGPTLRLHQLFLMAWLFAAAAVAGMHLAAATTLDGAPAETAFAARMLSFSRAVRPFLPVLAVLSAVALGTALARLVPWRSALSGTASLDAWFAAVWTLAAVLVMRRLLPVSTKPSAWNLSMWALVVLWPASRILVPTVGPLSLLLVLTGTGLLAAAVVGQRTAGAAEGAPPSVVGWLAAAGIAFVVAGVPLPPTGITPRLVAGSFDLAIGLALVVALTRAAPRVELARLGYAAAFAAGAMGAFQLALAAVGGVMAG
ncbi:MAG: hypothetical protein IT332_01450 [Ardenticatenales bacterium]|nr:hypothetical protein [Ardenticatenales bacterium]